MAAARVPGAVRHARLAAPGHDQHRQVRLTPQVRAGHEGAGAVPGRGQPQPCGAAALEPRTEFLGVGGTGRAEGLGGERVVLRAAERDPHIGQVGVRVDRAVPGAVGPRARGGDARRGQRRDQVTDGVPAGAVGLRADHFGDADRLRQARAVRAGERDPGGGAHAEPVVRRVVQREPVLGGVDVGMAERAPDDGRGRLVHRQAAGDVSGKADPQQPVLPNVAVHVGTELDPLLAVPEQGLLGDRQSAQAEFGDQARADGAALGPDPRGGVRRAPARSLRGQVPGALAPVRVARVFLRQDHFVAGASQHVLPGAPVGDGVKRPAAGRVGRHPERLVLDRRAGRSGPSGQRLPGGHRDRLRRYGGR